MENYLKDSDDLTISEALGRFYGSERIGDEVFSQSVNFIKVGPLRIPFPNLPQRRSRIFLHDINHLLTDFDTSIVGEGQLAAYELASGFPRHCWVGYLYAPFAFIAGFVLNPVRVGRAFKFGLGKRNACHAHLKPSDLNRITLGELKKVLNI